jgi:hypothetical protein
VHEFTDIAGPGITHEPALSGRGDGQLRQAVAAFETFEEMVRQCRDVTGKFPQGGDANMEEMQPVVEVFPEAVLPDELFQGMEGGRNEPDIHLAAGVAPDPADLAILDGIEHLGLEGDGKAGDFVEKQGSAIRCFKQADPLLAGIRKGAALVTEEL